jgi:hypothetical protein
MTSSNFSRKKQNFSCDDIIQRRKAFELTGNIFFFIKFQRLKSSKEHLAVLDDIIKPEKNISPL